MKKVRDGYKVTELGEIPKEWEVKRIIDIADTTSGGTPSRAKKEYYENGIYPWVKTGELYSKYIIETEEYITEEALKKSSAKLIPVNTVIMAMYGATIGKLSITKRQVTTNQACCAIICKNNICYNEYLYYMLDFEKDFIINLGAGGAQPNISQDIIKKYKIAIPTINEQEKIASILSSVDEQIDNVDKLIQKNKELKKGLMQQLLTKGIGHTKFKNTEIGEIPEEWEVNSNFIIIKSGFGFKLKEYVYDGIPLIRINNVMYGRIIDEDLSYLPEEYVESYKDFVLKKGDILLALNRPITNNRLKIGIVNKEPAILYQRVGKLEFKTKKYLGEFFYQYMQSDKFIKVLENTLVGSDQPYIKTSEFEKLKFPVPSIEEQQKIVSILSEVDKKIEGYENKKQNLEELKKGLMQQLLTGRIRVN